MMTDDTPTPGNALRTMVIVFGGLSLGALSLAAATGQAGSRRMHPPFVWVEIAAVSFLCAMPLAIVSARWLATRLPRAAGIASALLLLAAIPLGVNSEPGGKLVNWAGQGDWSLAGLRVLLSIGTAVGGTWFLVSVFQQCTGRRGDTPGRSRLVGVLLLAIAIVVPEACVDSRVRREHERLQQFRNDGRVAEALAAARSLSEIRPRSRVETNAGRSISTTELVQSLSKRVTALEQRLDRLAPDGTPETRLRRGRLLGQLSRRPAAIEELKPVPELGTLRQQIEACLLLGVLHVDEEQWQIGLNWYRQAMRRASHPSGQADTDAMTRALKGMGYSYRKLGRYSEAAEAYDALIAIAPTADHHFLLAQFYEDAQESRLARRHAEKAIQLAPTRWRGPGERLIDRLVTRQFGCFHAFRK